MWGLTPICMQLHAEKHTVAAAIGKPTDTHLHIVFPFKHVMRLVVDRNSSIHIRNRDQRNLLAILKCVHWVFYMCHLDNPDWYKSVMFTLFLLDYVIISIHVSIRTYGMFWCQQNSQMLLQAWVVYVCVCVCLFTCVCDWPFACEYSTLPQAEQRSPKGAEIPGISKTSLASAVTMAKAAGGTPGFESVFCNQAFVSYRADTSISSPLLMSF